MLLEHKNELGTPGQEGFAYGNIFNETPWKCTKVEDLYQGKCDQSWDGQQTKDNSIVDKCNFNNAIKISREWCKGNDIENIANMLGISKSVVSGVYRKAADVAENCIRSNINEWQVGGPGVVVIIDTYPEGCANTGPIRMGRPILCISEVKTIPQKYWLETLDSFDSENEEQTQSIKQHILHSVQSIIRPGSTLVTPYKSSLCSHTDFECLKSLYPTIVSVRDLAKHNNDQHTIFSILATIWKSILDICEEAQFYNSMYVQQFIISHMWRRRYGDRSFEIFLYQLNLMR